MVNLDVILTPISIEVFHEEPAHLTFQTNVVLNRPLQFRLADTVVALPSKVGHGQQASLSAVVLRCLWVGRAGSTFHELDDLLGDAEHHRLVVNEIINHCLV